MGIIIFSLGLIIVQVYSQTYNDSKNVYDYLFKDYNKHLVPSSGQDQALTLIIDPVLLSLGDFDEKVGHMSILTVMNIKWRDESLIWNPTDFNNVTYLIVPNDLVWIPNLYLLNPARRHGPVIDRDSTVFIHHDGEVMWMNGGMLEGTCVANVEMFPFDEQTCAYILSPLGYEGKVHVQAKYSSMSYRLLQKSGEWLLLGTHVLAKNNGLPIFIRLEINMTRQPGFYVHTMLLPPVILAFLNPAVFLLPVDSGERVGFAITVLLSFTVCMTLASDVMPDSSNPISRLSIYLIIVLGFSAVILFANILIIRWYHKTGHPPLILRKLLFDCRKSRRIEGQSKVSDHKTSEASPDNDDAICESEWKVVAQKLDIMSIFISYTAVIICTAVFFSNIVQGK